MFRSVLEKYIGYIISSEFQCWVHNIGLSRDPEAESGDRVLLCFILFKTHLIEVFEFGTMMFVLLLIHCVSWILEITLAD